MAKIVNGHIIWEADDCCGDGWFQTSERDPFLWACRWHDLAYQMYKGDGRTLRWEVDTEFLRKMLKIARRTKCFKLTARAHLYYRLVRLFGWIAWERRTNTLIQNWLKKIEASQQDLNTLAKEWVRHKDTITAETWREHLDYLVVEQRRIDKLIEKRNRLVLG